jgi:hypothetical protein
MFTFFLYLHPPFGLPPTSFCVAVAIGEKSLGGWTQELLFFSFCAMMIPFPVSQSDRESGALDLNNKIGADSKWPSSCPRICAYIGHLIELHHLSPVIDIGLNPFACIPH